MNLTILKHIKYSQLQKCTAQLNIMISQHFPQLSLFAYFFRGNPCPKYMYFQVKFTDFNLQYTGASNFALISFSLKNTPTSMRLCFRFLLWTKSKYFNKSGVNKFNPINLIILLAPFHNRSFKLGVLPIGSELKRVHRIIGSNSSANCFFWPKNASYRKKKLK